MIYTPKANGTNGNKRITSEAAENAALIIGIIAAALIAIVLFTLLILKFKGRPETHYVIDDGKNICQDPNAALLGCVSTGTSQLYARTFQPSINGEKLTKKLDHKDIKEWYV